MKRNQVTLEQHDEFVAFVREFVSEAINSGIEARYWLSDGSIDHKEFTRRLDETRKAVTEDIRKAAIWKLNVEIAR